IFYIINKLSVFFLAVPILSFKRFAGRKFQQDSRQRRRPPGLKRLDGDYVRRGEILVSQFYLNFHPGLNVNIDNKNTLTAMREGQVMMTVEKINPNLEHHVAAKYYANMSAPVVYKRFYHVIPFEQTKKFKLVNLV
ncbi:50S ribosomal protein L27-like, partial [Stegodyphus dumicola]|uniref:50S ribosomal protein L27-like n=1 Tax=Stegodyphus dumicola TaxID=202533 RepID=UPI0015A919B7